MKRDRRFNNNGFSLVELIIVIAIMAILAGAIAPAIIRYIDKAREGRFIADGKTLITDAHVDFVEQLGFDYDDVPEDTPISLGKIDGITCDTVFIYPDDSVDFASETVDKHHAKYYANPSNGELIGCVYNDGRYTGYWLSPAEKNEWILRKN